MVLHGIPTCHTSWSGGACAWGTRNTLLQPTGAIGDQIKKDFGSYDEFKKQFDTAGNTAFGLSSFPEPLLLAPLWNSYHSYALISASGLSAGVE